MMPNFAICVHDIFVSSRFAQLMLPVVLIMPEIAFRSVVLPAPFEPMRQAICPSFTVMSMPLRASMGP